MLLVKTDWPDFPTYVASLSKPARKNCKQAFKRNEDLTYECVPFDKEEVEHYMQIWERQLIRGQMRQWAFGVDHVQEIERDGRLRVFRGGNLALHFIERRNGYWECHPPMYDKANSGRYLAKWMWFNLIRFAIENKMEPLDLGGGPDDWVEHIQRRKEFPNPAYKWAYVPEETKQHPENEPEYKIINHALCI